MANYRRWTPVETDCLLELLKTPRPTFVANQQCFGDMMKVLESVKEEGASSLTLSNIRNKVHDIKRRHGYDATTEDLLRKGLGAFDSSRSIATARPEDLGFSLRIEQPDNPPTQLLSEVEIDRPITTASTASHISQQLEMDTSRNLGNISAHPGYEQAPDPDLVRSKMLVILDDINVEAEQYCNAALKFDTRFDTADLHITDLAGVLVGGARRPVPFVDYLLRTKTFGVQSLYRGLIGSALFLWVFQSSDVLKYDHKSVEDSIFLNDLLRDESKRRTYKDHDVRHLTSRLSFRWVHEKYQVKAHLACLKGIVAPDLSNRAQEVAKRLNKVLLALHRPDQHDQQLLDSALRADASDAVPHDSSETIAPEQARSNLDAPQQKKSWFDERVEGFSSLTSGEEAVRRLTLKALQLRLCFERSDRFYGYQWPKIGDTYCATIMSPCKNGIAAVENARVRMCLSPVVYNFPRTLSQSGSASVDQDSLEREVVVRAVVLLR